MIERENQPAVTADCGIVRDPAEVTRDVAILLDALFKLYGIDRTIRVKS